MGEGQQDGHRVFRPDRMTRAARYRLLSGCVVPRPIALVTSVDPEGVRNAAAFSFFNLAGDTPPTVMLSIDRRDDGSDKDTTRNIRASGYFVVNAVSEEMTAAMVLASMDLPGWVDEIELAGLEAEPGLAVPVSRLSRAPVQLECRLDRACEFEGFTVFFAEIVLIHVRQDALGARDKVEGARLDVVGRLAGPSYCRLNDTFDLRAAD